MQTQTSKHTHSTYWPCHFFGRLHFGQRCLTYGGHCLLLVATLFLGVHPARAVVSVDSQIESEITEIVPPSLAPQAIDPLFRACSTSDVDDVCDISGHQGGLHHTHNFEALAGAVPGNAGLGVSLLVQHKHEYHMAGIPGDSPDVWWSAISTLTSKVFFQDELLPTVPLLGMPDLASVQYVWKASGSYSYKIDIRPGEEPTYHLMDRVTLKLTPDGDGVPPNVFESVVHDPHFAEGSDPEGLHPLPEDVDVSAPIPAFDGMGTLNVLVPLTPNAGGYLPVTLFARLEVESKQNFFNDGAGINYLLTGSANLRFAQSADLLGIIVRDVTGAVRTDVNISSAEGIVYRLLIPEPAALLLLSVGVAGILGILRRTSPARC